MLYHDRDFSAACKQHMATADSAHSAQAIAAHNSGGIVIVQVQRIAARGSLPTRAVHIPGALVDKVTRPCQAPPPAPALADILSGTGKTL